MPFTFDIEQVDAEECPGLVLGAPAAAGLLDSTYRTLLINAYPNHVVFHHGRLQGAFADVAREHEPRLALREAVIAYAGGLVDHGHAWAALAVTGRAAWNRFTAADYRGSAAALAELRAFVGVDADPALEAVLDRALDRAYAVAWALRRPDLAPRQQLGWLAVAGEVDRPHRPVNVPATPYPQHDIAVPVVVRRTGFTLTVRTRYVVAHGEPPPAAAVLPPEATTSLPPEPPAEHIPGEIFLYIHGAGSTCEEGAGFYEALAKIAGDRVVSLVTVDLPGQGYGQVPGQVSFRPLAETRHASGGVEANLPLLEFTEDFVVAFVDALEARHPGSASRIVAVLGGSLGGNLGLRLAERRPRLPWLANVVSWSPASVWPSFGQSSLWEVVNENLLSNLAAAGGLEGPELAAAIGLTLPQIAGEVVLGVDTQRALALIFSAWQFDQPDNADRRWYDFDGTFFEVPVGTFNVAANRWYAPLYLCRWDAIAGARAGAEELYSYSSARWGWRLGNEQLLFSHQDNSPPRFLDIDVPLLLIAGNQDDAKPEFLFSNTFAIGAAMHVADGLNDDREGRFIGAENRGHAIHAEAPEWLAGQILAFIPEPEPRAVGHGRRRRDLAWPLRLQDAGI